MKISKYFLFISAGLILVGCASAPMQQPETKFTSYEDFEPGPEGGVDLVWARHDLHSLDRLENTMKAYDTVVIDQVLVVMKENELDQDDVKELASFTIDALKEKVSPFKEIVEAPTGRTLRVSIALSNVETPNPVLAVTSSVLPVGIAISTISKVTTGEHTNVGSASIELLVSDAQNNQPLFAIIDRQAGNKDFSTMIDSLDDAKDAITFWVDRLGVTLSDPTSQDAFLAHG